MNNAQSPSIKAGHAYELKHGKSSLMAFYAAPDKVVVKAGSAIDLELWPDSLKEGYTEPDWGLADFDLALSGCAERLDSSMILTFTRDYGGSSPLQVAQMATGTDSRDVIDLWREI